MTISLHIVADNCPPDRLDRALLYLQRVKPRTVDIAAGAELTKGMQFVERVKRDVPNITVIWRNLDPEDTGIHTKYTAQWVFDHKVLPHLAWFKKHEIVFMPDNESSGDDEAIKRYVKWQVEMAVLLHAVNLRGAFCRFSTGTIVESQYQLLKPIFNAMLPGDYISPNEYSAQPGYPKGSGGHLRRYHEMWIAAGRELPTVIGEAGIAMNYDPGKGYIDAGMTDEATAQQILNEEIWYENGKIDRHIYLVGGFTHEGYRLRDGVLDYWEKYYAKHPVETPAPHLPPPESWATGIANVPALDGVIIRAMPDVQSAARGVIKSGDTIQYDRAGIVNGWWHVKKAGVEGYSSAQFLKITGGELPAPNPEPPIGIPETPTPHPDTIVKQKMSALWVEKRTLEARIAAIIEELDDLLAA